MKVTIIAAVLTTTELTLYKEDGTTLPPILQGDPRLAPLVDYFTPFISVNQPVEVDLSDVSQKQAANYFAEMEEKTGGIVKFFRVAKKKLASWLMDEQAEEAKTEVPFVDPCVIGTVPTAEAEEAKPEVPAQPAVVKNKTANAVAEIMANAKPASADDFRVPDLDSSKEEDTVVAVVDGKIIPDAHNLGGQVKAAIDDQNSVGLTNFMRRVAAVAEKRNHSVEDLMKFMRRGDLPLTDSGDILVYKALKKRNWGSEYAGGFKYADIHSGNVPQKVGSYVFMNESLVDHDRRNECSNGLHIARRQYLSGFRGDVCVVALVRPEDVIAVPQYDANKMRVCGYHIIHELSDKQYQSLLRNEPITDEEDGQLLLGRLLSGQHIGVLTKVEITSQKGKGIVIHGVEAQPAPVAETKAKPAAPQGTKEEKPAKAEAPKKPEVKRKAKAVEELPSASAIKKTGAKAVDPKAVAKKAAEVKTSANPRQAQAAKLYEVVVKATGKKATAEAAQALLDFKKKAKVSWTVLGLEADMGDQLKKLIG